MMGSAEGGGAGTGARAAGVGVEGSSGMAATNCCTAIPSSAARNVNSSTISSGVAKSAVVMRRSLEGRDRDQTIVANV